MATLQQPKIRARKVLKGADCSRRRQKSEPPVSQEHHRCEPVITTTQPSTDRPRTEVMFREGPQRGPHMGAKAAAPARHQRDRRSTNFSSNTVAARYVFRARATRSTNVISFSTTSIRPGGRHAHATDLRRSPDAVRDVLSQRWVLTEKTYERQNPKRVYYLSMEFLIGRSLANNVTNLLLDPLVTEACRRKTSTVAELLEQEPDAGLGNGGLGTPGGLLYRIRRHHCSSPPWATVFATNTASSSSPSRTAGSRNSRTTGCAGRTPGRWRARNEQVEVG